MQLIKGFVIIGQYINNSPGDVALLGELSTWSRTYTKENGEYIDNTIAGYKFVSFKSIDADTNEEVMVHSNQVSEILALVKESTDYANSNIRPYLKEDFTANLLAKLPGKINDIRMGKFIDNGYIALPEWISWNSVQNNNNSIKIWLSDSSFSEQYDDYEITIIPPLEPLDNFFNSYTLATAQLKNRTMEDLSNSIEQIKDIHPETYIRIMSFDFINKINPSQKFTTHWAAIIYGKEGDNIDIIKDSLIEHILSNSTHTESEWLVILPDIFKRTEFVILPRWDKIAIPNLTIASALYSSIVDVDESANFASNVISFYDQPHIIANLNIIPFDYKAVSLLVVNGYDNEEDVKDISLIIPDYIPVNSLSLDFNRMSIDTRNWILMIKQLLIIAETADSYTGTPDSIRKIRRNGKLFIANVFNNINYLVAARSNDFYQESNIE